MNDLVKNLLSVCMVIVIAGCQDVPAEQDMESKNAEFIQGIKLTDLKESVDAQIDDQKTLIFQVYTFSVEPEKIRQLGQIAEGLSQKNIRYADKEAFNANGISVGITPYQKGSEVIQKLQNLNAILLSHGNLAFPEDVTEILTKVPVDGLQTVLYSTSETGLATVNIEQGMLGWVITAHPDPSQPGQVQVKFEPAFWHTGLADLRLKVDKEMFDFETFSAGRFLARMTLGDMVVIAPAREEVPIQETLDKYLFYVEGHRPKVQIFIVVCKNPGIQ